MVAKTNVDGISCSEGESQCMYWNMYDLIILENPKSKCVKLSYLVIYALASFHLFVISNHHSLCYGNYSNYLLVLWLFTTNLDTESVCCM